MGNPEYFEYILLQSDIFASNRLKKRLTETYNYADSEQYFSWEQYYTALIVEETKDTEKQYHKSKLNPYYLSEKNKKRIVEQLPEKIRKMTEI